MSQGRSIRLFLVDGNPTGMITAEIMNWTGHLLTCPRSRLPDALKRTEASRTGVYFLTGEDPGMPSKNRLYIGEGDSVAERLKSHAKDASKDFWTHVCIVTSKDANLTKAHVRYLEGRLLELTKAADRFTLANGTEPSAKQLPESDVADMEFFIGQLQVALPVIGLDFLREKPGAGNAGGTPDGSPTAAKHLELSLYIDSKKNGVFAQAVELNGEVTVSAGATATTKAFASNTYANRRAELISAGFLVPSSAGDSYTLTSDYTFGSPGEAAAVLLNRNSNGRVEWRVVGSDVTLKAWQDSQLEAVATAAQ